MYYIVSALVTKTLSSGQQSTGHRARVVEASSHAEATGLCVLEFMKNDYSLSSIDAKELSAINERSMFIGEITPIINRMVDLSFDDITGMNAGINDMQDILVKYKLTEKQ